MNAIAVERDHDDIESHKELAAELNADVAKINLLIASNIVLKKC